MQKHLTVKELPGSEKPYEKCLRYGAQYLSDAELLAAIFRTGTAGQTSIEVAQQVLLGGSANLLNLYDYSLGQLMHIRGIGQTKAVQLKCIAEISRRIAQTSRSRALAFHEPGTIAAYYMEQYRHEKKEHFWMCMFDSKCHFLGDCVLSVGSVDASLVSPREIFMQALRAEAVFIILLHNHPSGEPQPSAADESITQQVAACGRMLHIALGDHIIIGDNNYYSFRERGQLGP